LLENRSAGAQGAELYTTPLLELIAANAADADAERSVANEVIDAIKSSDVMRLTAAPELDGLNGSALHIARELEGVAGACTSTAWCLWNHLATFHLFCGLLGPDNAQQLKDITRQHRWVCFPAGASTAVKGALVDDKLEITGQAAFGSGARYADFAGVSFMAPDLREGPSFSLVDLHSASVHIDPTWKAMSLRASATDHVNYKAAQVSVSSVVKFPMKYRVLFRDPKFAVIHPRYREDWVALSDLWLGAMAVGVAATSLAEVCDGIAERIAIMGVKMVERPTIHVNLGQAAALIDSARDTVMVACAETDERIAAGVVPTEVNYLRQLGASMIALQNCDEAMRLMLRVLGGNGLREGGNFERRYRDFQAMPLHINAHRDRLSEQLGRERLGLPTENLF